MRDPETNIAISGHAEHGKSTLAGRILVEFGAISPAELERRWQRAPSVIPDFDKYRKGFNKYNAVFLDRKSSTFSKGTGEPDNPSRSVVPARGNISVANRQITIIDQPGVSRFIGNIIYGLYQADLVVLVIDAKRGIQRGTKRIAQLCSHLKIPVIAICVTKMDEVGFSETVFRELEEQIQRDIVRPFLGVSPRIIPIHALSEHPLSARSEELGWYNGAGLMELLRTAQERHTPASVERLRCAVRDVYGPPGVGTVIVGVLETGVITVGESLVLEPAGSIKGGAVTLKPRSLQVARGVADQKKAGVDTLSARVIAAIATNDLDRDEAAEFMRHGGVLGRPGDPPLVCRAIEAELVFFRADTVYSGSEFKIRANACDGEARIIAIENKKKLVYDLQEDEYDASVGEVVKASVQFIRRPICIEADPIFHRLTRFVLLENNEVVACGRCLRSIP